MKSDHSGNGREHVTETPDVSHIRNLDVTHEMSDVQAGGILKFAVGLTIMTIVVYLLMWGMFRVLSSQEQSKEPPASPMAMTSRERLPPEPRLQAAPGFGETLERETGRKESQEFQVEPKPKDPLWEINELRERWRFILNNGAKDQSGKFVSIPIDEAKKELLKQGLPVRQHAADFGLDLPTAASSGRMTEKRKQ